MSTKKVSELTGAELDAAVAKAGGLPARSFGHRCVMDREDFHRNGVPLGGYCAQDTRKPGIFPWSEDRRVPGEAQWIYNPGENWSHGGPIIERERISIIRMGGPPGFWLAGFDPECDQGSQCESGWIELPAIEMRHQHSGPTPLIAAMRAYVASKFGETVEV